MGVVVEDGGDRARQTTSDCASHPHPSALRAATFPRQRGKVLSHNLLDLSIQARSGDCFEITLEDGDVDDGRLGPAGP
jgi:hypothetical protein